MGVAPDAKGLHAAAQVADAHGTGKGVAVHLAESLHLHGAGKRNDGVGQQVQRLGQKAHRKQQQHLAQHHQLPPVQPLHRLKVLPHFFRSQHPQRKGAQRHQIVQYLIPPAIHDIGAQQHDIAGLGIGKHLAPEQIGVGILQAAGQRKEHRRKKGLGHLPVMLCFHTCTLFSGSIIIHFAAVSDIIFTYRLCFSPQKAQKARVPFPISPQSVRIGRENLVHRKEFLV